MAETILVLLDAGIEVKLPSIPNFILLKNGQSLSIADLNEKALEKIADEWRFQLIKKAKNKLTNN